MNVYCTWDRHESLGASGQPLRTSPEMSMSSLPGNMLPYMAKGTLPANVMEVQILIWRDFPGLSK